MKKRLTTPSNNKYYIRQVTGGLNGAVAGSPTIRGANVLCNCVGFANGRFNEILNDPELKGIALPFKYQLVCNAENFIESAKRQGLKISSTPVEGGIMVWQKGSTLGGGDGAGHVAVVEEVYKDGTILTSESGWASWAFKTVRRSNRNGRWDQGAAYKFRGCIINPGIKDPKVVPVPPLVVDGIGGENTVRAMQRFLGTPQDGVISGQRKDLKKYYPAFTAVEYESGGSVCIRQLQKWLAITQDGVMGQATVKALQKKLGVTVDGIFGTNSMKAWQKYLNDHKKAKYPTETKQDKMLAWAKKIAGEKYHYVAWQEGVAKTHTCPICTGRKYDDYYGWNCIGFSWAAWHHGSGLASKCNDFVFTDYHYNQLLKLSDAEALKMAKERIGLNDIKLIRNKNGISTSELKAGDVIAYFDGSGYVHTALYIGSGQITDCTSGRSDGIKYGVNSYTRWKIKLAFRYTGK